MKIDSLQRTWVRSSVDMTWGTALVTEPSKSRRWYISYGADSVSKHMESLLPQFLTNILAVEPANNATSPTVAGPSSLPISTSLLGLLFSFSALRDWLKLFFIGGFFESCRRLAYAIYYKVVHQFYITAEFHEDDNCYGPYRPFYFYSMLSYI